MCDLSEKSFIPSEDLEHELDNIVLKLKDERKTMNLRLKQLEKKLKAKDEETKALMKQNADRLNALLVEMNRKQKLLEEKEDEMKTLKEEHSGCDDVLKENESLTKTIERKTKENKDLEKKNKDLEKDKEITHYTIDMFANKDVASKQRIADLEAELSALKERMKTELERKDKKIEQTYKEIKDTNDMLSYTKSEKEKAHKQIASDEQYKRKLHDKIQSLANEHNALQTALKVEHNNVSRLSYQYNEVDQRLKTAIEHIRSLEGVQKQLEVDKQGLLLRLGKVDGANVTYKKPNIADVSDEKRPTKLAEEFSELYDNQWTDAFEEIEIENEEQKTNFMLELLTRANKLCVDLSREHIKKIKICVSTLTLPIPSRPRKQKEEEITIDPAKDKHITSDEIYPNGQEMKKLDFEQLSNEQKKIILDARRFFEIKLSDEVEKVVCIITFNFLYNLVYSLVYNLVYNLLYNLVYNLLNNLVYNLLFNLLYNLVLTLVTLVNLCYNYN